MPKSHAAPYAPEFRRQMVELVRIQAERRRSCHASSSQRRKRSGIGLRQAERDAAAAMMGFRRRSGLSWPVCAVRTASCVRSARSWQKRRPGSHGRPARSRPGLPVHERAPGRIPDRDDGTRARRVQGGLLCVATSSAVRSCCRRQGADEADQDHPRDVARDLRRPACACRAAGRRAEAWTQAYCPADACSRDRGASADAVARS